MDITFVSESLKTYTDYPLHQHRFWEIIFSLEGTGTMQLNDRFYPFQEGTVFLIPPWTPHKKTAENGFKDGCMFVSDMMLPGKAGQLVFEDEPDHSLLQMYRFAYNTQLKNEPNAREIINAIGDVIWQILVRISNEEPSPNREMIEQFKSLLLSRLSDPTFRVSDAVSLLGYSESYFRKVCRRTLGCTPVEYFTRLRVEHAKQLLKQYRGIRNIAEIAENSGFTDPYYFSRKFRQVTGMSPREYSASASENILLSAEVSLDETDDPEYLLRHRRHS